MTRNPHSGHGGLAHPLFLLFLLLMVGGAAAFSNLMPVERAVLVGFDAAATLFLAAIAWRLGRAPAERLRSQAARDDAGRVLTLVVALVVSLVVLIVVGIELREQSGSAAVRIALIGITLLLVWLFGNIVYALHYAHMFYDQVPGKGDRGGLLFPGSLEPDFWDFCYFAFVIGATFQVSDVQIASAHIRRVATMHSLAAFLFNIGILALTVNVIGSAV